MTKNQSSEITQAELEAKTVRQVLRDLGYEGPFVETVLPSEPSK